VQAGKHVSASTHTHLSNFAAIVNGVWCFSEDTLCILLGVLQCWFYYQYHTSCSHCGWAALTLTPSQVHWFSIMNSLLVVLVMAGVVALILVRTVRRDLAK
jgi:hypothetical protein